MKRERDQLDKDLTATRKKIAVSVGKALSLGQTEN